QSPVFDSDQSDLLSVFFYPYILVQQQIEINILVLIFDGYKISLFFCLTVKFDIFSVIVITQYGIFSKLRGFDIFEFFCPRIHLFGNTVNQISGKNKQIIILLINQINAISDLFLIVETTTMQIGNLQYFKPIKSIGQIIKIYWLFNQMKIVFAFDHAVQNRKKRNCCQTQSYLRNKFSASRKLCLLSRTHYFSPQCLYPSENILYQKDNRNQQFWKKNKHQYAHKKHRVMRLSCVPIIVQEKISNVNYKREIDYQISDNCFFITH